MMDIIRSIINFFGFNDTIIDGIGERGMRDSSIIRYNEVHDMYDKIIKDLGDMSAYVSKGYIYDKIKDRTGLSTRHISRILNHTKKKDLRFIQEVIIYNFTLNMKMIHLYEYPYRVSPAPSTGCSRVRSPDSFTELNVFDFTYLTIFQDRTLYQRPL